MIRYEVSRGTCDWYKRDAMCPDYPWIVEKVMSYGERTTIGTFLEKDDAHRCLDSLKVSLEVLRGARVMEDSEWPEEASSSESRG